MLTVRRALLLTDVVDSTKLSEAIGDEAMARLWSAHDRVARDLLVRHGGREIDKTDGFLMLFEDMPSAAEYAVAYHRALSQLEPPIAARAGIHVGQVILTENAPEDVARGAKPLEVDGIAKPMAARVMSLAGARQTLITEAARHALGPTSLRLEPHGHWRMKGVSEPMALFEVGEETAPFTPPADAGKVYQVVQRDGHWLPRRQIPHRIPAERNAFVGRGETLVAVARRFQEGSRLVSLLGTGGAGKTRLSIRFAWTWLGDYPGGIWFCDLSEARTVQDVAFSVAATMEITLSGADPTAQIAHALSGPSPTLMVLDNFEQVAHAAEATVGAWLDAVPNVSILVTTRERLGVAGEVGLPLPSMSQDDALALFERRASDAKPGFTITKANREDVEALVELLDRLPLAMELAAARARVMRPDQLLTRMSDRFRLLSDRRGGVARQATLKGALDWSWDLLDDEERSALAQLSVFDGGFDLEAAEAVLELDLLWGADAVQALVDKSLVRHVTDDRFDLLVSVQAYATEKLDDLGGGLEAEQRHGAHYSQLGDWQEMSRRRVLTGDQNLRRTLAREFHNISVAASRAVQRGDVDLATGCTVAKIEHVVMAGVIQGSLLDIEAVRGLAGLGVRHQMELLACEVQVYKAKMAFADVLGTAPRAARGFRELGNEEQALQCDAAMGFALSRSGRPQEAVALFESRKGTLATVAPLVRARIASEQSFAYRCLGDHERQIALLEEAASLRQQAGDQAGLAAELSNLGDAYGAAGDPDKAWRCMTEALAVHDEVGARRFAAVTRMNMAILAGNRRDFEVAHRLLRQAREVFRKLGLVQMEVLVLVNQGLALGAQGRLDEAIPPLVEAMECAEAQGNRLWWLRAASACAHIMARAGRFREAQQSLRDIDARLETLDIVVERQVRGELERARALLRKGGFG